MFWFAMGGVLGWWLANLKHAATRNPRQALAWTSLLYGLFKQ